MKIRKYRPTSIKIRNQKNSKPESRAPKPESQKPEHQQPEHQKPESPNTGENKTENRNPNTPYPKPENPESPNTKDPSAENTKLVISGIEIPKPGNPETETRKNESPNTREHLPRPTRHSWHGLFCGPHFGTVFWARNRLQKRLSQLLAPTELKPVLGPENGPKLGTAS